MKALLVLSVPHTGTMFTLDLLPGRRGVLPDIQDDLKYWCHLRDPYAQEARARCLTVVPIRRYDEVKESWVRRNMDTRELDSQWIEMCALQDVFILPLDSADRDEHLQRLSRRLGVALQTDWRPVNSVRPH